MNKKLLAAMVIGAAGLAWAPHARADLISIGVQQAGVNGGAVTTEATGSGTASTGTFAYGSFTFNTVTAYDTPDLGGLPDLVNSNSIDTSSPSGGTITIFVTTTGLPAPVGVDTVSASFTTNSLPAGWTLTEETLYSSTGALYGGSKLNSANFTGPLTNETSDASSTVDFASGYSFTEEYIITASGSGNTNDTIDTTVPEPGSLLVLGTGLFAFGLIGWTRRRRSV